MQLYAKTINFVAAAKRTQVWLLMDTSAFDLRTRMHFFFASALHAHNNCIDCICLTRSISSFIDFKLNFFYSLLIICFSMWQLLSFIAVFNLCKWMWELWENIFCFATQKDVG
jgi:hypothetical protein